VVARRSLFVHRSTGSGAAGPLRRSGAFADPGVLIPLEATPARVRPRRDPARTLTQSLRSNRYAAIVTGITAHTTSAAPRMIDDPVVPTRSIR
jgi:hypothetical protein